MGGCDGCMDEWTDRRMDRYTERQADRWLDGWTERQVGLDWIGEDQLH